ncbi:MAG: hypothetical protein J6Y77_03650 [Paludibacteraceae bacterium]|nr:hypothetical protein [Paludibacteraceae bacterium]
MENEVKIYHSKIIYGLVIIASLFFVYFTGKENFCGTPSFGTWFLFGLFTGTFFVSLYVLISRWNRPALIISEKSIVICEKKKEIFFSDVEEFTWNRRTKEYIYAVYTPEAAARVKEEAEKGGWKSKLANKWMDGQAAISVSYLDHRASEIAELLNALLEASRK